MKIAGKGIHIDPAQFVRFTVGNGDGVRGAPTHLGHETPIPVVSDVGVESLYVIELGFLGEFS